MNNKTPGTPQKPTFRRMRDRGITPVLRTPTAATEGAKPRPRPRDEKSLPPKVVLPTARPTVPAPKSRVLTMENAKPSTDPARVPVAKTPLFASERHRACSRGVAKRGRSVPSGSTTSSEFREQVSRRLTDRKRPTIDLEEFDDNAGDDNMLGTNSTRITDRVQQSIEHIRNALEVASRPERHPLDPVAKGLLVFSNQLGHDDDMWRAFVESPEWKGRPRSRPKLNDRSKALHFASHLTIGGTDRAAAQNAGHLARALSVINLSNSDVGTVLDDFRAQGGLATLLPSGRRNLGDFARGAFSPLGSAMPGDIVIIASAAITDQIRELLRRPDSRRSGWLFFSAPQVRRAPLVMQIEEVLRSEK